MSESLFQRKIFKKRHPGTSDFLWILQNFQEHHYLQNTVGCCFCHNVQVSLYHLGLTSLFALLLIHFPLPKTFFLFFFLIAIWSLFSTIDEMVLKHCFSDILYFVNFFLNWWHPIVIYLESWINYLICHKQTDGIYLFVLHLFINNQKFKQLPRKSLIVKQFPNNLPGGTRDEN